MELIRSLVRWHHRYDVEIDDATPHARPGNRDIELGD